MRHSRRKAPSSDRSWQIPAEFAEKRQQSDARTGEVEIRLRNRGPDAYRPTEYGDSITVVRKFSADGGSRYMLKSVHGKLVSDKREELHKILDQFNIQVDNPVAILNQDTSRNFLHSKNACDKYKFFLKATQLEQMQRDYELANERKTCTIDIITVKEKMMPKLKAEVCKWEDKFKNLGAISDLREKVKSLKQEMAWAFVYEKEKQVTGKTTPVPPGAVAQHDYEAERRARQQKMEMLEEQIRSAESRQRTTHHEREQYQAAVSRYKEEVYSVSRDEKVKQNEKDMCHRNLQTLQSARSNRLKRFGAWCVRNSQFLTVLDILQCEDPVVANALIDQAFTREGDQLFCLPTFRYYSTDMTTARFLTSDVEEEIIHQKRELERLAQEVKDLAQRRSVLSKDIAANAREEKKCETQLMKIGETITNLKYELNELRCVEDPAPVDISTLEELSAVETELDTAKQHRKHYETKLSEQEKNIKQERKKVQEMKKEIEVVEHFCITELTFAVRRGQGDPEEITRCYNEKKTSYLKMQKEVKNLKRFIDKLDKAMQRRQEACRIFRTSLAWRTTLHFNKCLRIRSFLGKMNFNHKAGELNVWVSPTEDSQMPKDLKTLSGGERSFSTVCFILSLWNAMESPFRCLDEFDVFMDMVNRQISMDMMLEVAKSQMERQFIFLTPQDMSSMRQRFNFRIFQMPNPDRTGNQSTLPFRPVGQARAEEEEED
nr:hypothetical protein BaRGS_010921 [Batillaria attramentaria]